mmetsp:Transcript_83438/g.210334  ORF Transcript_83438/g.210334 Transcript_83438/m.210334 type:complete len:539 (-) Transcript_83438:1212-2828(-)
MSLHRESPVRLALVGEALWQALLQGAQGLARLVGPYPHTSVRAQRQHHGQLPAAHDDPVDAATMCLLHEPDVVHLHHVLRGVAGLGHGVEDAAGDDLGGLARLFAAEDVGAERLGVVDNVADADACQVASLHARVDELLVGPRQRQRGDREGQRRVAEVQVELVKKTVGPQRRNGPKDDRAFRIRRREKRCVLEVGTTSDCRVVDHLPVARAARLQRGELRRVIAEVRRGLLESTRRPLQRGRRGVVIPSAGMGGTSHLLPEGHVVPHNCLLLGGPRDDVAAVEGETRDRAAHGAADVDALEDRGPVRVVVIVHHYHLLRHGEGEHLLGDASDLGDLVGVRRQLLEERSAGVVHRKDLPVVGAHKDAAAAEADRQSGDCAFDDIVVHGAHLAGQGAPNVQVILYGCDDLNAALVERHRVDRPVGGDAGVARLAVEDNHAAPRDDDAVATEGAYGPRLQGFDLPVFFRLPVRSTETLKANKAADVPKPNLALEVDAHELVVGVGYGADPGDAALMAFQRERQGSGPGVPNVDVVVESTA